MNRVDIIQAVIDRKKSTRKDVNYLEVGVLAGDAFFRIKANYKIGVDPNFTFSRLKQLRYCFKNPTNFLNHYYEVPSDSFFEKNHELLSAKGLDVVFLDGLHTYDQSLKDVQNSLKYLNDGGVIILHDCNPMSEIAAMPAESIQEVQAMNLPGWDGVWNGDVWKTIAYLRSNYDDLNIFVLNCDFGVGVITRGKPETVLNLDEEDLKSINYKNLEADRKQILNLKGTDYLVDFCNCLGG